MIPQRFPQANIVMHAPSELPEGACGDIHAFIHSTGTIVCFQPTPEDVARIVAGGPVWVNIMADPMPPVAVHTDTPFIEPPDERRKEELEDGADCCAKCTYFLPLTGRCLRWSSDTTAEYVCHQFTTSPNVC